MADFQIKVQADAKQALDDLKNLNSNIKDAAQTHRLTIDSSNLNNVADRVGKVKDGLGVAKNNIREFYSVSKNLPFIGQQVAAYEKLAFQTREIGRTAPIVAKGLVANAGAGTILAKTFATASRQTNIFVNNLAKLGYALYGIKEANAIIQSAFGGFFNQTIGRQIQLRETILKTQTALASTSKVFKNGVEITDPYEKIVSLTNAVQKNIDSIRKRSIELAGVTSGEVIEVFGIVAQQVGEIGAGLQEAEDLAISFAAALGTFGLPLYQARQEIGSILRGDIGPDSYLAKALGIGNEDVAKAKASTEGLVKYLENKLAAAVAGQRIAAEGFKGVTSNIAEIGEEIARNFGAGLLDPLLKGLTNVFNALFSISKQMWDIAKAFGEGLGNVLSGGLGSIGAGAEFIGEMGNAIKEFADAAESRVTDVFTHLESKAKEFAKPLRDLLEEVIKLIALLGSGLKALAAGFVAIKIETLQAAVGAFAQLAGGFKILVVGIAEVLKAYGDLLQVPVVQWFAQIAAILGVLNALGVLSAVKFTVLATIFIVRWKTVVAFVKVAAEQIKVTVLAMVGLVGSALTSLGTTLEILLVSLAKTNPHVAKLSGQLKELAVALRTAGNAAQAAAGDTEALRRTIKSAGNKIKDMIVQFMKVHGVIIAVSLVLGILVDAITKYRQAQEQAAAEKRFEDSLKRRAELLAKEARGLELTATEVLDLADAEAALTSKYRDQLAKVNELKRKIQELQKQRAKPASQEFASSNLEAVSGITSGVKLDIDIKKAQDKLKAAEQELNIYKSMIDKRGVEEKIRLEKQERINLAKEIAALERQFQNDNFQARQALEQTRLELLAKQHELEILGIEEANELRLTGEEGAAKKAGEIISRMFIERKKQELSLQAQRERLAIDLNALEKSISDYKYETQKKINELRKKANIDDLETAELKRQLEEKTITKQEYTRRKNELTKQRETADIEKLGAGNSTHEMLTRQLMAVKEQIQNVTEKVIQAEGDAAQKRALKEIFPVNELQEYERKLERVKREVAEIRSSGGLADLEALQLELQALEKAEDITKMVKVSTDVLQENLNKGVISLAQAQELHKQISKAAEAYAKREETILRKTDEINKNLQLRKSLLESINSTNALETRLDESQTRYRLELEGLRNELIEAELEKARIRKKYEQLKVGVTDQGAKELDERAAGEAALVDKIAQQAIANADPILTLLKQYRKEVTDTRAVITSLASTITSELGSAMSQSIEALIEGTQSVQEIFANMFKNIGKAFIDMATQMIAKWMMMKVIGLMLPGAGAGGFSKDFFDPMTGLGAAGPNFGYATGGIASGPETGYSATLHGTEAVVPLPDGKRIPVEISGGAGGPVNSVVNVTISDSGTTVNRNQASQLGRMIETSVMGILSRERRPGGILRT